MAESTIVKKLGIKPGQKLLILNAPKGYTDLLGALPEGVQVESKPAEGAFDFVQAFAHNVAELERTALEAIKALKPGGLLWFCYPKLSSKLKSDLDPRCWLGECA